MSNFRKQLDKAYDKKVVGGLEDKTRSTALIAVTELVNNTPVDTGRARGNWNLDINAVNESIDSPEDESGFVTITKAEASLTGLKIDDTAYISNHLPYIERLNDGHSQQSPAGFVEAALQVTNRKAREL